MLKNFFFTLLIIPLIFFSCRTRTKPKEKDIVVNTKNLDERITEDIEETLQFALENQGKLNDSLQISALSLINRVYENNSFHPLWSLQGEWLSTADSLYSFIQHCKEYGLFSSDYHFTSLQTAKEKIASDSLSKKNAILWTHADLMLTDAFLLISKHLHQGRLQQDSVSIHVDSAVTDQLYLQTLGQFQRSRNLPPLFEDLEPKNIGYDSLKTGLSDFLDSANFTPFTYLQYPFRDSMKFVLLLQKRLAELNVIPFSPVALDINTFRGAIASYQQSNKLKVSGKIDAPTINSLNNTDLEKFTRIAINLDRFKMLPDTMPFIYVWVNIPSYNLWVMDSGSVVFDSRVIVGKPDTRTPLLNSNISNFITYPQWTVPFSIVFKEMIPSILKDSNYLQKQNLMVVDKNDSVISPDSVNWARMNKKNFPYQIKQREGDDNSLGVIKFNFRNKYSVYLHDTNARWLFSKTSRALSHGCVRLQQWKKLANFLVRNEKDKFPPDSLQAWISRQEKHIISSFPKVPVFIRYFSCDTRNGKVRFFEDIYGEDKMIRQKYFAGKTVL